MNKKKQNTGLLATALILTLIAITAVIILFVTILDTKSTSEDESVQVSTTESIESSESEEDGVSSDNSMDTSDDTSMDYENYIGVEYAIDISEWEQYISPEDDEKFLILVNKTNTLDESYVPPDLVDVVDTRKDSRATQKMVFSAEKALEAFLLEGREYDVTDVDVTSAYRTYAYQKQLFDSNVQKRRSQFDTLEECEAYVETFSARPGTSEHQTGLACDMHNISTGASIVFADTPEGKWLAANAHRFGFIIRYPEDKTDITGYQYEPWHFRFVGRRAATEIYEQGLCLEEYIDLNF